ncbi:MAG: hypothetical protein RIS47_302 [Bacteroidota bacterium]|jgi:copper chaperone CopZ
MKTFRFFLVAVFALLMGFQTSAQTHDHAKMQMPASHKTVSFKVWGNCGSCKARIEKVATTKGVSKAEWNKDSKIFTAMVDTAIISTEALERKIAKAGHDTQHFAANAADYDKLPGCCQYDRKP